MNLPYTPLFRFHQVQISKSKLPGTQKEPIAIFPSTRRPCEEPTVGTQKEKKMPPDTQ
jgi:hypothetical protein